MSGCRLADLPEKEQSVSLRQFAETGTVEMSIVTEWLYINSNSCLLSDSLTTLFQRILSHPTKALPPSDLHVSTDEEHTAGRCYLFRGKMQFGTALDMDIGRENVPEEWN